MIFDKIHILCEKLFLAVTLSCWECSSLQHKHCDNFSPHKIVDEYDLDRYVNCSTKCLKMRTRGMNP